MIKEISLILSTALFLTATEYSRKDILSHAFENSEALAQIDQERKVTESMKKEYFAKAFPSIKGNVYYEHALKSYNPYGMDMGLGGGEGTVTDALNTSAGEDPTSVNTGNYINAGALDQLLAGFSSFDLSPKKNTASVGVSVTQPIFAQGKVGTGLKMAEVYAQTIEYKYQEAKFEVAKEILNSYNGALVAEEYVNIQTQAVELATETHRLTKARFTSGQGNQLDTLNSQFSLVGAKFSLRDSKKNRRLAIKNMMTIASLDVIPDSVKLSDSLSLPNFSLTKEEALGKMIENNRTLKQIEEAQKLQELNVFLAKTDFFPMIFAGADFGVVSMYNGVDEVDLQPNHKLYAGMSVPIFSAGQRVQKVRQADYETVKLSKMRDEVANKLRLGLAAAYEELAVAKEEVVEANEMIALTEQGFKIATIAYEIGQITRIDLTDSEQNLKMARLAYNSAVHKINVAVVSIKKLVADSTLIMVN
jgi:outer membrane protein TolC